VQSLEPVPASFFDTAPTIVTRSALIAAPRERVFDLIAGDPAGWGDWFPGFTHASRWETPAPHGVGSVRTVSAFATTYRETVLVWDEGERWAFRVDEMSSRVPIPLFAAYGEDYRLADEGASTRLTWTIALRARLAIRVCTPLLPFGFGLVLSRVAAGLTRVAGS
jgi:hypothetical protein